MACRCTATATALTGAYRLVCWHRGTRPCGVVRAFFHALRDHPGGGLNAILGWQSVAGRRGSRAPPPGGRISLLARCSNQAERGAGGHTSAGLQRARNGPGLRTSRACTTGVRDRVRSPCCVDPRRSACLACPLQSGRGGRVAWSFLPEPNRGTGPCKLRRSQQPRSRAGQPARRASAYKKALAPVSVTHGHDTLQLR